MNAKQVYRRAYLIFVLAVSGFIGLHAGLFYYQYTLSCRGEFVCTYGGPLIAFLTGILAAVICAVALLKIKSHVVAH